MSSKRKFKVRHVLFLLFLIYVMCTLVVQQLKISNLAKQEAQLQIQMEEALNTRDELKKEISLLHTDKYIEKIARDELGLVKPGEYIYKDVKNFKK